MNHALPEGKLARSRITGVAAAKVGISTLKHKIKRPFLSQQAKDSDKELLDDNNAKIVFAALTQLRGTALKLAQVVGMDQGLLPEVYRKELEKSFHQVPALNRVLVRKLIIDELKQTPNMLFKQFEAEAFAAASLGQVHKAVLHKQDKTDSLSQHVAVKVQYPGINTAIKSDLSLIRGIAKGLPNTPAILQALDEVEARLTEEVDYYSEAKNTAWFKKNITLHDIHVPHVYTQLSSERILTTEFIEGLHLDDWLATQPSQIERNQKAQLLYDFFIHASQDLQCLHADPNPGNYLFHEDRKITVIDFGCVRKLSDQFNTHFSRILRAFYNDDAPAVFEAYADLNMVYEDTSLEFYSKALQPFGEWITRPYRKNFFDFKQHKNYLKQGQVMMKEVHHHFKVDFVAEEFIFHNRTYFGLLQIFEKMGASVRFDYHKFAEIG